MNDATKIMRSEHRQAPVAEDMVADYLDGPAYTLDTYLAYTLSGKAKSYAGRYKRRMQRRMRTLSGAGLIRTAPSLGGSIAWTWTEKGDR